jgi:hypothetical protein
VIIWLNGAFGGGKTSTAVELASILPGARQFDAEWVGYMLRANLADQQFTDFQQLRPWRTLVPAVMQEVIDLTGQHLIAVQTVLVEEYWQDLRAGLDARSLEVFHVLLHADPAALAERIRADQADPGARQWRLDHIGVFEAAMPWLETAADLVIDSTRFSVADVARAVADAVLPLLSPPSPLSPRAAGRGRAGRLARG